MKNEFGKYTNLKFIKIENGHYCLDNGRFVKDSSDAVDKVENLLEQTENDSNAAIELGGIDKLKKSEQLDNELNQLIEKMELDYRGRNYKQQ